MSMFGSMGQMDCNMKFFKHIFLLCFVLFSLSPCTVRDYLSAASETENAKPLNKNRTTSTAGSCTYFGLERQKHALGFTAERSDRKEPFYNRHRHAFAEGLTVFCSGFSYTTSGNSPPKYILYKRLKIDLA